MNIYESTETSFLNNGLGFLTDCISAYVEESLNGDYTLNITYPLNGRLNEYLVENNIIKTNVGNDNYQLFRIARVNKTFKEIEVYALHISYDLLNNMLVDTYPQNLVCQAFGEWILSHTQFNSPFTFVSDISTSKSARYVRRNPIEVFMGNIDNSMVNLFGGEVERDNFTFKLLQSRGQNNHVKLMFGKNITEIKTIVDITSMFTRIMPIGYDGLILPEKFIDSPLINNYPTPRITKVEFSDIKYDPESTEEGVYTNIEDAYEALRNATYKLFTLGIDKPQISIKIDWLELSKTEQYKTQYQALERVRLGDTIIASLLDFDYTTKVVKTTYNVLTDTIDKFEIGTIQKTIANTINQNQSDIQQIQPDSILDEAKQNATNLINSALGGYIYLDYDTGNLYIMDTDNPSTAQKVWRWNLNGLGYSSTGINGTYGIAMTMDGQIVADFITTGRLNTNVIEGYGALELKVQTNSDDIATIKAEISDIADITTSSTSETGYISPDDFGEDTRIANSSPIHIEVHPLNENISYLYPFDGLYPSNTLYLKVRKLKFHNILTDEVWYYTLPEDLLYYDADNYDTFVADYDTDLITITKKCGYNADGSVKLLDDPVITTLTYSDSELYFSLTEGRYEVSLVGYNTGYLMARLMVVNAYTAQYATKVELNNSIEQVITESENYTNIQVGYKVGNNEVISKINLTPETIKINANRINITGVLTAINNDTTTTINGNKITTGTISATQIATNAITTDKLVANSITATKIADATITGAKIANSTITGGKIADATITGGKIQNATITGAKLVDATISGAKIQNATIDNSKIISISADKITAGYISADRISGGTISSSSVSIGSGSYYLRMGANWTQHPQVSGLNVGSGGIAMNNHGISHCHSVSNASGDLYLASNSGTVHIGHSVSGSGKPIEVSGSRCYINQYLDVTTVTFYVRKKNGTKILIQDYINEASSKKIKENIKPMKQSFKDDLYEEVKNLNLYSYDYKEKYRSEDRLDKYGFMIDDIQDKNIAKILEIEHGDDYSVYSGKGLAKLDLILIKELQKKIDELEAQFNGKTNDNSSTRS